MSEQSDTDFELLILRLQIGTQLLHLGVNNRLRRHIVKTVESISNVHKLTVLAQGLGNNRRRMHEAA